MARIDTLARAVKGGLSLRVHGDLHLGQVLVIHGDAYLIDFEGEPARPLAERRARHSPYKDVSGVLRSFDYAAAMALNSVQGVDASPAADTARERVAQRYLKDSQQAFLDAYRLATQDLAHGWEAAGEDAALALFTLEKAAYEVTYEARNRPDWLSVPLRGLAALL